MADEDVTTRPDETQPSSPAHLPGPEEWPGDPAAGAQERELTEYREPPGEREEPGARERERRPEPAP